jgi:tetratricopeptide (TPR) repeat protein
VPAAEVPRQLPARSAGFAGRVAWLARLDALLPPGDDRPGGLPVATISGVPGIGKTTLAVHWAHRVADRFPDGQLYLDLRGFDPDRPPVDPATGLAILLGALGVAGRRLPASQPERESLYRTVLADRRVLLVLDNAHDAAQVRPLLPGGDRCLVLVTSRNPLAGLVATGARPMVLDLLGPAEAGDLLEGRLGRARVAAEPDAVAGIADRCGGLPLALSIVAARAAVRDDAPLGAVVAELGRSRRTLDEFAGDDASADLRAVFSWSYRILGEPAARLLRLLAVHPGPDVTAPAAASLAGTPVPEAHAALRELHAASLLTEVRPDRYAFHDLVRAYAAELAGLSDPPERLHAALVRLLDHLVHTALAATLSLDPHQTRTDVGPAVPGVTPEPIADRREALVWFETERPVILAAVERAADGFESHAWRLAWTSVVYLERSGQWHDKLAVLSTALDAARRTGERTTQARTLRSLGRTLGRLHDYGAAYAHLRSAIALYRDLGDVNGQAHAAGSLGEILEHEGRYEEALAMDEESYELFAAAGNRLGQARALGGIGSLQTLMGRHEQTIATCQRALELFVAAGDRNGQAGVHDSLGVAYGHLGRHAEAVACFRQALEALESTGEQFYVALVLAHLGDEHLAAAEVVEARHCYDSALAIFTRLGSREAGAVRDKLALLEHGYFTPAAGA